MTDITRVRVLAVALGLGLAFAPASAALAQSAEDGFDTGATGPITAMVVQPDGKILVGGSFAALATTPRSNIGRLNSDGTVDPSFNPGANGSVSAIAVQPDGKILVGGSFTMLGGGGTGTTPRSSIGRLNADGTLDASFDPGADSTVRAIAVQSDGRIVVGGSFIALGGGGSGTSLRFRLGRLNADGSLDSGFDPGTNGFVSALAVQANGRILVGGSFTSLGGGGIGTSARSNVGRLLGTGAIDTGFDPGANGEVTALAVQPDTRILIGGAFTLLGGGGTGATGRDHIARLNADGTLDGLNPGANGTVLTIELQGDQQILIGGFFNTVGYSGGFGFGFGYQRTGLARLTEVGTVDTTFDPGSDGTVNVLRTQADGKILVGGTFLHLGGGGSGTPARFRLGRLHANGSLEAAFDPGSNGTIYAMAIQPDGKILVGGNFSLMGGGGTGNTPRSRLARLNPDGTVDAGFSPFINGDVEAIAVQPDGKIVVGGAFTSAAGSLRSNIARLNADGSVDGSFDPGASAGVHALALQSDGKILVGGWFSRLGGGGTGVTTRKFLGRLETNGAIDTGFDPGADSDVYSFAVQPDGRIVVGGLFTLLGGGIGTTPSGGLGRLESNGGIDLSFRPGSDGSARALALQPDGKILVAGAFSTLTGTGGVPTARSYIGRLNTDGTLDAAFNPGANLIVYTLALQADGKVLVGGAFTGLGGGTGATPRSHIGRLLANGTVDASFDPGANGTAVNALALQRDGKVLVGGDFSSLGVSLNGVSSRRRIGRLTNTGAAIESLALSSYALRWLRSGTGPEVTRVTFETSTDGSVYSVLGPGTRIAGGWKLTGLNLTPQQSLFVRARGYHSTGYSNASESIADTTAVLTVANPNLVQNGAFASGATIWTQFALPDANGMVSQVTGGVFEFYRVGAQAVVFQPTGEAAPAAVPITARFDLGNSSNVRKRISILLHDADFTDLSVCTFWLPANLPLTTYGMRSHTTKAWTNLSISFYAASVGGPGTGFYRLDNVSVQLDPLGSATETFCDDATAPTPPGGGDSPSLLTNGDFANDGPVGPGWSLFGQIVGSVSGGVFQFVRPAGTPAGSILQPTFQPVAANELLTATFQLGNTDTIRKRVTVILHDNDFTDLSACTFWLAPGQPLSNYAYRTFATRAWSNATLSVYPATIGGALALLDNVTLRRTPSVTITGTECLEPGSAPDAPATAPPRTASSPRAEALMTSPPQRTTGATAEGVPVADATDPVLSGIAATAPAWIADGFLPSDATVPDGSAWEAVASSPGVKTLALGAPLDLRAAASARLVFDSWLAAGESRASVQVSLDGSAWETVHVAVSSDTWVPTTVDLGAYAGNVIQIRFVFDATAPADPAARPDIWRVDQILLTTDEVPLAAGASLKRDGPT